MNILAGMRLDPSFSLGPVCVQKQQSTLATTLDQLIGLGHQLVGQQPRVGDLELIQCRADALVKLDLVLCQQGGIDGDVGQTRRWLDELGST